MGIARILTSPFHPQTNGKCERLHPVLNDIIAKRVAENQLDWPLHIPAALFAIRTSVHSSSKHTPYFLVYGRDPKLPIDTLLRPKFRYLGEDYVPTMIQRLHRAYVEVKANLRDSQARNQAHREPGAELPTFSVGDKVFYAKLATDPGLSRKLAHHWQPYFRVLERRSPVNYLIKHLPTNTVKLVHASHLRQVPCDVEWDSQFKEPEDVVSPVERSQLRQHQLTDMTPQPPLEVLPSRPTPTRRQPLRSCRLSAPIPVLGSASHKRSHPDAGPEFPAKRAHTISAAQVPVPKRRLGANAADAADAAGKRRRLFALENRPNGTTSTWWTRFWAWMGWPSA